MIDVKIRDFFQRNIGYAAVVLACGVYLAMAFVRIDETGKTLQQIIFEGAIVFVLAFFINRNFDLQGIMNGEKSELYQNTMSVHGEMVMKVSPEIDKLDEWCAAKNLENLRVQRVRILAEEGLRYGDYFNTDGSIRDEAFVDVDNVKSRTLRRLYKRRNRCVRKALRIKLTPISAGELTSEGAKGNDPYDFGRTKAEYEKQMSTYDAISKVIIAVIFGYYGVELLQDFSYANLIWHGLQVATFILIGAVSMYNAYLFITTEHRGRIVKKVNLLEMFDRQMQKEAEAEALKQKQAEIEATTTKETEVKVNEQQSIGSV